MKKRIGIFMGEVRQEYQRRVLKAAFTRANELGYDVFVFAVYGAYGNNVLYAEGEKSIIFLPDLSGLDGIIVADDTFDIEGMEDELSARLKKEAHCPVVYLRSPTDSFYNVMLADKLSMKTMVQHFIMHHGFRDICFMQGKMNMSDARRRYDGYLEAMKEAGIPVTEHMVFEGNYWRNKGREAIDWFMEGRKSYPQAIVCANDYMALSVCEELQKRGVRVPEDVCVSGYDDALEARRFQPSITSIKASFEQMACKAVDMIENVNRGVPQNRVEVTNSQLTLRRSCGCGPQEVLDEWAFMHGIIIRQEDDIGNITRMITECQDALYDEEEYFAIAENFFWSTHADKIYFCFGANDEEEKLEKDKPYSDKMVLRIILSKDAEPVRCTEKIDRGQLLPAHILEKEPPNGYLVFGIHFKNRCLGYAVMVFGKDSWLSAYTQSYLACIANIMDGAYMSKEIGGLKEIRELYQRDPLTGIYNRRGFEKQLKLLHNKALQSGKYLTIVSVDMDGLKHINDEYGHAEGDEALKILAEILQSLLQPEEICARMGGDEFSAILLGESSERHMNFTKLFTDEMKRVSGKLNKAYPLSASVGVCCMTMEDNMTLMGCMQKADKEMYIQKKQSKLARK